MPSLRCCQGESTERFWQVGSWSRLPVSSRADHRPKRELLPADAQLWCLPWTSWTSLQHVSASAPASAGLAELAVRHASSRLVVPVALCGEDNLQKIGARTEVRFPPASGYRSEEYHVCLRWCALSDPSPAHAGLLASFDYAWHPRGLMGKSREPLLTLPGGAPAGTRGSGIQGPALGVDNLPQRSRSARNQSRGPEDGLDGCPCPWQGLGSSHRQRGNNCPKLSAPQRWREASHCCCPAVAAGR